METFWTLELRAGSHVGIFFFERKRYVKSGRRPNFDLFVSILIWIMMIMMENV